MLHRDPIFWFPFCPRDWFALAAKHNLSTPAQGVLIQLLCHQWEDGSIPADPLKVAAFLPYGFDDHLSIRQAMDLFKPLVENPTRLHYPPLTDITHAVAIKRLKLSKAGKRGMEKRYHKKALRKNNPKFSEREIHDISKNTKFTPETN